MQQHTSPQIVLRSVDELIPYASNARTHSPEQIEAIANSIREFGFNNPILIDSARGVIAGHGRLFAAQHIGLREVPTVELSHLSDAQKRAYIIADNQLALSAGWNFPLLASEIEAIAQAGIDVTLLGFSDKEMAFIERLGAQGDTPPNTAFAGGRFLLLIEFANEGELREHFERFTRDGLNCKVMD